MKYEGRKWPYAAFILISLAFLPAILPGLSRGFDGDDLMNVHEAVEKNALGEIVWGLIYPFTPINRPTGELYYRICYWLFGWNPLAFRLVTDAFMAANVALVFLVGRRLISSEGALLAALLFAFHGRLWQIYVSNGTVYDVLCAFFSLLALKLYIDIRTRPERIGWRRWAVVVASFVVALNAKEMAAVLPVLFLIYDWACASRNQAVSRVRWMTSNSWPAVALIAITLASFLGKTSVGSAINAPAYRMSFTVASYFYTARFYFSELFYLQPHALVGRHIVFLFVFLFVVAAILRRRELWFLAWFAVLAPLPVLFIPPRSFFVMYLPLAGWAMLAAAMMVFTRDRLLARTAYPQLGRFIPLGLCVVAIIYGLRDPDFRMRIQRPDSNAAAIDLSKEDFLRLSEPIPAGASILLTGSRFSSDANPYFSLMIAQLLYRDRTLVVDRAELLNPPPGATEYSQYDRVIAFDGAELKVLRRSETQGRTTQLPSTSPAWKR